MTSTSKKTLVAVAVAMLTIGLFGSSALADDGNKGSGVLPPVVDGRTADHKIDPELREAIATKRDALQSLRAEAESLHQQIRQQTEINKSLFEQLKGSVRGDVKDEAKAAREQLRQSVAAIRPLKDEMKALHAQLQEAKASGDREAAEAVLAQIGDLKETIRGERDNLKAERDELKDLFGDAKELRGDLKELRSRIQPLLEQKRALREKIDDLVVARKATMEVVRRAHEAHNVEAVLGALNGVIEIQEKINASLRELLQVKVEIGHMLAQAVETAGSNG
jgi:chromosome segregation ATPase